MIPPRRKPTRKLPVDDDLDDDVLFGDDFEPYMETNLNTALASSDTASAVTSASTASQNQNSCLCNYSASKCSFCNCFCNYCAAASNTAYASGITAPATTFVPNATLNSGNSDSVSAFENMDDKQNVDGKQQEQENKSKNKKQKVQKEIQKNILTPVTAYNELLKLALNSYKGCIKRKTGNKEKSNTMIFQVMEDVNGNWTEVTDTSIIMCLKSLKDGQAQIILLHIHSMANLILLQ